MNLSHKLNTLFDHLSISFTYTNIPQGTFFKVSLPVSQRHMYLTEKWLDVSFIEPSFSEQWGKRAQIRRETKVYISPPGLGMMGVPGGPPPPGGP